MALLYPREMLEAVVTERKLVLTTEERDTLFAIVDAVFFVSLMVEEGDSVRVAVVHHSEGASGLAKVEDSSPEGDENAQLAWDVTAIVRRPLDAPSLAKLSRGLAYGTQLVVLGGTGSSLWIEGIARRMPRTDGGETTRVASPRPGVIVFERNYREVLRFEDGRRMPPSVDVLGEDGPVRRAVGAICGSHGSGHGYSNHEWVLRRLIMKMRATGHGALLTLLPTEPDEIALESIRCRRVDADVIKRRIQEREEKWFSWMGSVIKNVDSETVPIEEVRAGEHAQAARDLAEESLDAAIDDLARLSAIDGAVVAGPGLAVYGAGYMVPSGPVPDPVRALDARATRTEEHPRRQGSRHQAAFSFAYGTPGGVAFVVSKDGPVRCALRVDNDVVLWSVYVGET